MENVRAIDLALIKLNLLHHASKEEIYGVDLVKELTRHGYRLSFGTPYSTLAKMVRMGLLTFEARTVNQKQRKYYRITAKGLRDLNKMMDKMRELYEEVIEER